MKKQIITTVLFFAAIITLSAQAQKNDVAVHEITRSELLKMSSVLELLKKYEPAVDYSAYTFRSFEFSVVSGSSETTELVVGSAFNEKVIKRITDAQVGSRLYFEKIGALEPIGRKFTALPSIILKIKE